MATFHAANLSDRKVSKQYAVACMMSQTLHSLASTAPAETRLCNNTYTTGCLEIHKVAHKGLWQQGLKRRRSEGICVVLMLQYEGLAASPRRLALLLSSQSQLKADPFP